MGFVQELAFGQFYEAFTGLKLHLILGLLLNSLPKFYQYFYHDSILPESMLQRLPLELLG